ncbi:ATP-binding protein [Pelovirga terrestris]|uniref:histidine kinase n=1 Tax=Pelovirga terrestris TaxID=2771352 RepID=A0A8J6UNN6_9BACT|nr:sensor histidine kinase [Pelovirga terrestris]MBD1399824.1 sensor histidine kinase [Pelovirga terrestris]
MDALFQLIDRLLPRRLQVKLSLLVTILLMMLVSLIGALFSDFSERTLREQLGRKALNIAQSVAINPVVIAGIKNRDVASVQLFAEKLRAVTGAEYVVVGDREGIRLSHPEPDRIGRAFVGGDLGPALSEGRSYVSAAVGTLGPSLRGIVPVLNGDGGVIGFVAVGYLTSQINDQIRSQRNEIIGYVAIVLLFGVFGATLIARGLKAAIMGLEVHEIGALFKERSAIIGAVREGIIAVDGRGYLTFVNAAALKYLERSDMDDLRGGPLAEVCPCPDLAQALADGKPVLDQEMLLAGRVMLVNIVPLQHVDGGMVVSFRPKDELDRLTRELTHVQEYSELLRTQTHEYSNKMHTIAGLLQLEAYQEALDLVINESSGYQELVRTLAEAVPDPVIAGLILGKYNRACELKITMEFDPQNSFVDLPSHLDRDALVTILGNLLNNAFEAVRERGETMLVRLYLTDLGPDLVIEVEDSGVGVAPAIAENLFDLGVTTKQGTGRGTGLPLVKHAVTRLQGEITYGQGELGGALFTVMIPKQQRANG